MATEVGVSDHLTIHEEVKEIHEDHVKEVEQKIDDHQSTEEKKDSPTSLVENLIDDQKPKIEEPTSPPAVQLPETDETEPIKIEEVKKTIEEQTEVPTVVEKEKETSEAVKIEEAALKTEVMATENETKSSTVEQEEKKPGSVEEVPKVEEVKNEEPKTEKEPEKIVISAPESEEKTVNQKVEIAPEEIKNVENKDKDIEPTVSKDCVEEKVPETTENEKELTITQETVAEKNNDQQVSIEDVVPNEEKKEETEPEVVIRSVPADEIAMLKDEKPIIVEEKKETHQEIPKDVIKEEPKVDGPKETEKVETKEEPVTNGSLEPVKISETQTKEEKLMTHESEKATPRQSISIIGKVKKSFAKAKKAITGKNTPNSKTHETKEDETPRA